MSYEFYKVLHILGILTLVAALGGLAIVGQLKSSGDEHKPVRKMLTIVHGVALFVILVAGFGMMARKGIGIGNASDAGWPGWLFGKIGVWLAFGASVAFIKRSPFLCRNVFWLAPLLGAVGAYLAVVHPGAGPGG